MTIRFSTAARTGMLGAYGFKEGFAYGCIEIRSGPQPTTADAAPTGTLLGTVTPDDAGFTAGVAATNTITSNNTQVTANDTVTINGKVYTFVASPAAEGDVHFETDADTTLGNLVKAINGTGTYGTDHQCAQANAYVSAGAVAAHAITLTARTKGTAGNFISLAKSAATLSVGGALFSGGVAPVGLTFDDPVAGVVSKAAAEDWKWTGLADGIAGWFRLKANVTDAGGVSTTLWRMDGSIAASGADMDMANVQIETDAPDAIPEFEFEFPA